MLICIERAMNDNSDEVVRSILTSSPSPEPMYKEEIKFDVQLDHVLRIIELDEAKQMATTLRVM